MEKHKKILFLITKSNWGGAQRYVYDLATNLPTEQYEVVVAHGDAGELEKQLTAKNICVVPLQKMRNTLSPLNLIGAIIECLHVLRVEKPDVLHTNSSVAGFIGVVAGRLTRTKKIIFTAHGWAFNEDRPQLQKYIFKFFHWVTVLLSHQTIAVSRAIASQMNWVATRKKMTVIHPGREITELKTKPKARGILETKVIDSEANLSDYHKDLWIGSIAELHPIKRIERAIDAVAALSTEHTDLRYVIIGDGQLRDSLQQRVRDLGVQKHIFFTGSIHEAGRLLKAFDIFVLPSKSESFGYVLLEAGIATLPVVATRVGGVTDILTHEETGLLVPPDDTPALTSALRQLITNKELRHRLGQAHRENTQTFSLQKMGSQTSALY